MNNAVLETIIASTGLEGQAIITCRNDVSIVANQNLLVRAEIRDAVQQSGSIAEFVQSVQRPIGAVTVRRTPRHPVADPNLALPV